jgi:hypothetical protein
MAVWVLKLGPFRRMRIELLETMLDYFELKRWGSGCKVYGKGDEVDCMAI